MSIRFDSDSRIFVLETARTSYHMKVDALGHLLHLYYGKTIGTGQDAVAYAVLLPLQGCFLAGIGAGYGQAQFPVGAQRCQLAGEPTAAYIAGTCQPAGSRRLRQYSFYKPEDVHKG